MKKIIVLGASGTIGKNTIDIIRRFSDRFSLVGFGSCELYNTRSTAH